MIALQEIREECHKVKEVVKEQKKKGKGKYRKVTPKKTKKYDW